MNRVVRRTRRLTAICLTAVVIVSACASRAAEERAVDFERDILPIFRRSCFGCHGPEKQTSGYRLDVRQVALSGGDGHAPNIVPGTASSSSLIEFVEGRGGLSMPPDGPRLASHEVDLLRSWIDQGADWPDRVAGVLVDLTDWWSFRRLVRPAVPLEGVHPVDAFVSVRREAARLRAAPETDRRTLIRRLSYDLTGLPPTPTEVQAFVADDSPDGYERLVDRLLASPRYGERQARLWMDAIHFAETHGHDQDRIRPNAWPYRDYLIEAFNADTPWDRMIEEQVAGDAIYPDDPRATVALGFLAAGPWDESSLRDIREDTLDRQIGRYLDRDDMIGTVMNNLVSLTVQCARCHDHKFDPISQVDYYALQAVFAGVERANRRYDSDPVVRKNRLDLLARRQALEREDPTVLADVVSQAGRARITAWESRRLLPTSWRSGHVDFVSSAEGSTLTLLEDGSVLSGGSRPERDDVTVVCDPAVGGLTGIRLEVLPHESLPHNGPGRQDNGNLHLSEIRVFVDERLVELCNPSADFNQKDWEIAKAIDGNPQTAWGIYPEVGRAHEAVFELRTPLAPDGNHRVRVELLQRHGGGHLLGRFRLTVTADLPPFRSQVVPEHVAVALRVPVARRSDDDWRTLGLFIARDEVERAIGELPVTSLVYAAASDFEPDGGLRPPAGPRRHPPAARAGRVRRTHVRSGPPREVRPSAGGRRVGPPCGARPLACRLPQSVHLAFDRQSRLAAAFRPGSGGHAERFRSHGREAVASGAARLACR